jgi:monoamine oxidase
MGQAVKVALQFRTRFWEDLDLPGENGRRPLTDLGFVHSPDSSIPTWWTQLPVRVPLLVGWSGGPNAESLVNEKEVRILDSAIESLLEILRISRKKIEGMLEKIHFHNWYSDPFARGAYSYVPVDGLAAQSELSKPVEDTLFFAGEATNTRGHCGTVHGAIATGKRAANEILKRK